MTDLFDMRQISIVMVTRLALPFAVGHFEIEQATDTNKLLYNVGRRGIEFDLLPWCQSRGIPVMAYSPIEQGRLLHHPEVIRLAEAYQATPAQIALAFVLERDGVIAIPKTSRAACVKENRDAVSLDLTDKDWAVLDAAFPPPARKTPLEML